jgi:hypothetical protein
MTSRFTLVLSGLVGAYLILVGASLVDTPVRAYSAGPDPATTGGFKEATCNQDGCHNSFAVNAGKEKKLGDLVFEGLPTKYEPGKTYPIKVTLTHKDGRQYWGFELATRVKETGAQAGKLTPADKMTQVIDEKGIQYIEHTIDGTESNTFAFNWVAPDKPVGEVSVDVAGNAADGDGGPEGDYIYTANATMTQ